VPSGAAAEGDLRGLDRWRSEYQIWLVAKGHRNRVLAQTGERFWPEEGAGLEQYARAGAALVCSVAKGKALSSTIYRFLAVDVGSRPQCARPTRQRVAFEPDYSARNGNER
jgi:hypothetical protein